MRFSWIRPVALFAVAALLAHAQCYANCLVEDDGSSGTSDYHHHDSSIGGDAGHDGDTGHDDDAGCLQQPFVGPQFSIANVSSVLPASMMLPAPAHLDRVVIHVQIFARLETGSPPPILASAAITILRV